jgi:hypothetical protein
MRAEAGAQEGWPIFALPLYGAFFKMRFATLNAGSKMEKKGGYQEYASQEGTGENETSDFHEDQSHHDSLW